MNQEEIENIALAAIEGQIKDCQYDEKKVPQWISNICENCLEKLNAMKKPYKYLVTCSIAQKTYAGITSTTASYFDLANDFVFTFTWPGGKGQGTNKTTQCTLTIFLICYSIDPKQFQQRSSIKAVSYTHLTLPTILLVQISVVAVSLKKKKKKTL
eukprot:TRINITY_DN12734_c0_g1_i5.p1 TRINITY_DN12734_c0_g1~~TRINITY_DN12734_c0_g1_i5.p1  ORF type:complete len:156 (+),score=33.61 TRINITY_DN12734_c0_g1_i5:664-1131(+)